MIFLKYKTGKQTHYLNNWVVEGTSKAFQLQLSIPCVTTLGNIIRQWISLHVRIQPSKNNILASISFWTSIFKERQCSISWSDAPWWKAHERAGWYQTGNSLGTRGGSLVWTRFLLNKMGSSLHMSLGLGQTASLEPVVEAVVGVWALAEIVADSNSYSIFLTRFGVLLPRMLVDFLFNLLHECCRCELTLDEDSRTTFETRCPFMEKKNLWDSDLKLWNARWCKMFMQK